MNKDNYKLTLLSCFTGTFAQAICTNIISILFVPFITLYGFKLSQMGVIIGISFSAQLIADFFPGMAINKFGFRVLMLPTTLVMSAGLFFLALTPYIFPNNMFIGVVIAATVFSFSTGLIEVMLSPIASYIPQSTSGKAMGFMHSFYNWGFLTTVILISVFLFVTDIRYWQIPVVFLALVPLSAFFMFKNSKFPAIVKERGVKPKSFILKPYFIIGILALVFGVATEALISQLASVYMEESLGFDKLPGDLLGLCLFVCVSGIARIIYGKFASVINLNKLIIYLSILSILCYLLIAISPYKAVCVISLITCGIAISLMCPGGIILLSRKYPHAGGWLFILAAMGGDIGCTISQFFSSGVLNSSLGSKCINMISRMLHISEACASPRAVVLICIILPILTLTFHCIRVHTESSTSLKKV